MVGAQTCSHEYVAADRRPIHDARKCTKCGQHEYWSPLVQLWLDAAGVPVSAERGPVPPPMAA